MVRLFAIPALVATTLCSSAHGASWTLDPGQSSIEFRFSQSGSETTGRFDEFSTQINFDPADLPNARITAEISIGSFNTGNSQIDSAVAGSDWFNLAEFPLAKFVSTAILATADGGYDIEGEMFIRDFKVPITLSGDIDIAGESASAAFVVELNRIDFGIGQGDFSSDKQIGHAVPVSITIQANAKD